MRSRSTRFYSLVLPAVAVASACSDDSPGDDAGPQDATADRNLDGATEPVYVVATRIRTPDARTVYVNLYPDLSAREIDTSAALELPGLSRIGVFDGRVFAFDGETGNVIRYAALDDLTLREEGRFSMAGLGVVRFRTTFAFLSTTRAYYLDIPGQQMVVFNPSALEIVGTFPVPEVRRDGFDASGGRLRRIGDEVFAPVSFSNLGTGDFVRSVSTIVIAANEDRVLRTLEDDRCVVVGGSFVDDNQFYALGDAGAGLYDAFGPEPQPPCLLRASIGASEFEASFMLTLAEVTGRPRVSDAVGRGDGTFLTRVFDSDVDLSMVDPTGYYSLEVWRYAVIDVVNETASFAQDLPLSGISFDPFVVDGAYYGQLVDETSASTTLYRIEAAGTTTESLRTAGELQVVARVR